MNYLNDIDVSNNTNFLNLQFVKYAEITVDN